MVHKISGFFFRNVIDCQIQPQKSQEILISYFLFHLAYFLNNDAIRSYFTKIIHSTYYKLLYLHQPCYPSILIQLHYLCGHCLTRSILLRYIVLFRLSLELFELT